MMRAVAFVVALLGVWLALVGAAPVLVPDISSRNVEIRTSFSGEELLLFGAIAYPGGTLDGAEPDIAVVLRGPTEAILVREKQKVAGIWMNAASHRFRSAPGFYAVASSAPIETLIDDRTAAIYEIGIGNLQLSPGSGGNRAKDSRFEDGLIARMRARGLYVERPTGVEINGRILYRAALPIPSRVPVGDYIAQTFLIANGRVLAVATRDVAIGKSGFERFVAVAAQRKPFAYGLAAVAISLFLGWLAAALFARRDR